MNHHPNARNAPRTKVGPRDGSSLIEVVVATLMLSLVVIGTVEFFAKGRFWFDQEESKRVATLLAQEAMERTATAPYEQVLPLEETHPIAGVDYALEVTVDEDSPESSVKTVRAVVSWQAVAGGERTVSLATLVYDN